MSSFARFQLQAAAVIGVVYLVFAGWMMDGSALGARSPEQIGLFMVMAFLLGAVVFGGLWVVHMRRDGDRKLADEREAAIDAAAERVAARITDAALFVLLMLALSDAKWDWMGSFSVMRMQGLVFVLFTVSAMAGMGRFFAGFLSARRL